MVSNQQIAAAIRQMRSRYISESKASSYWEINNGLCDDFARDVAEFLGGETDDLYSVENGNFQVDGDTISGKWDWGLLEKHWGIKPCMGLKKNQACAIDFGSHVWLTDGKLHYDAECPDGVTSFFELPIFRRCVVLELRNNGVACDDVVTDDVLPSPHCPVPNPEPSIKHPRMQAQGTRKMTTKKVAFVPLAAEKLSHQRTVEDLRRAGYAVVLFEPNELGVASSRSLEARLVELGTEAIADLQDHSEIEEEPENAKK